MYDAPWARGIVGKQVSVEGMAQQTRSVKFGVRRDRKVVDVIA